MAKGQDEGGRGDRKRQRAAADSREAALEARDIGAIPVPANLSRRKECLRNFQLFNETYFEDRFELDWSEDHEEIQRLMQSVALNSDCFALAMDRGGGKSTLCETLAIFSILGAFHPFVAIIAAAKTLSEEMLESIKSQLDGGNAELAADFPEICYPFSRLEGISNRCKGQLSRGQPTYTQWKANQIVFPTVKPGWKGAAAKLLLSDGTAKTSGAAITTRGIEGGIRGMVRTLRSGKRIRPTLAIVDDPQTEESANSFSQTQYRLRVLKRAVRRLAGPGKQTAVVVPCTVMTSGDLADQLLDHETNPHFHGRRFKMVYAFPDNLDVWEGPYDELRREGLNAGVGLQLATEYYKKHRRKMQKGARVAWAERFDPEAELDAVQHAMNLYLEDRDGFWAECQNTPRDDTQIDPDIVTPAYLSSAVNQVPRAIVPEDRQRVIAAIDVQGDLLYWAVVAFAENFSADVVEYGSFPDQAKRYYTLSSATNTLSRSYSGTPDTRIRAGLVDLVAMLDRDWPTETGEKLRLTAIGVDSRYKKKAVFLACRENSLLVPTQGIYIGARTEPLASQSRKDGDRVGPAWRERPDAQFRRRKLQIDANEVKGQIHAAFAAKDDVAGRLRLYGRNGRQLVGSAHHAMLADHVCAEKATRTTGHGRDCLEFELPPSKPDNHIFDCLVAAFALASRSGCALPGDRSVKRRRRRQRVATDLF